VSLVVGYDRLDDRLSGTGTDAQRQASGANVGELSGTHVVGNNGKEQRDSSKMPHDLHHEPIPQSHRQRDRGAWCGS
jgi:hypothetical protein